MCSPRHSRNTESAGRKGLEPIHTIHMKEVEEREGGGEKYLAHFVYSEKTCAILQMGLISPHNPLPISGSFYSLMAGPPPASIFSNHRPFTFPPTSSILSTIDLPPHIRVLGREKDILKIQARKQSGWGGGECRTEKKNIYQGGVNSIK